MDLEYRQGTVVVRYSSNQGGDSLLAWLQDRLKDPPEGVTVHIRPEHVVRARA